MCKVVGQVTIEAFCFERSFGVCARETTFKSDNKGFSLPTGGKSSTI